jgi:cytochrome c oxidase subunit I+III
MLFPLVAGVYYWLPHFSGRMPFERLSKVGFWLSFIGFNGTFLVMHWTGLLGMPRRVYTYEAGLGWDLPNLVSSIFSFVMAFGVATVILDVVLHFKLGRRAPLNPWEADTLEWASGTPPRSYNFASLPPLSTRHPLWDDPHLPHTIAAGQHALAHARHGRRETLGSDPVSGRPREVIHLPGNSWWPLIAGLWLALLCILLLLKAYGFAAGAALAAVVVLLRWSWENGAHPAAAAGEAHDLPDGLKLHSRTFDGPGLWGMGLTLLADAALFTSLLFGWLYLWTVAPHWEPPAQSPLGVWPLAAIALGLGAGTWCMQRAVAGLKAARATGLAARLGAAAAFGACASAGLVALLAMAPLEPTRLAHDAVLTFTLYFLLAHAAVATVLATLQAWRVHLGYVGVHAPYEPVVVALWWRFTTGAAAVAWLVMALLPLAFRAGAV